MHVRKLRLVYESHINGRVLSSPYSKYDWICEMAVVEERDSWTLLYFLFLNCIILSKSMSWLTVSNHKGGVERTCRKKFEGYLKTISLEIPWRFKIK